VVKGHEREGRIDYRIGDGDVQAIDCVDRLPVFQRGSPKRIDRECKPSASDRIHIDDLPQVVDIGYHQIVFVRCLGTDCDLARKPLDANIAVAQQRIGPILDPLSNVGIGRAAIARVVLDPTVLGRIMRWREDDPVCQPIVPTAVVYKDGVGDYGRRRVAIVSLDDRGTPLAASTSSAVRCAGPDSA
jgi:hypothetical protein